MRFLSFGACSCDWYCVYNYLTNLEGMKGMCCLNRYYLSQVALEEKRLINALKNGDVVNEEPPPVIVPPKLTIKDTLLKEQPLKELDKNDASTKWGLRSTPRRPEQQVKQFFL